MGVKFTAPVSYGSTAHSFTKSNQAIKVEKCLNMAYCHIAVYKNNHEFYSKTFVKQSFFKPSLSKTVDKLNQMFHQCKNKTTDQEHQLYNKT